MRLYEHYFHHPTYTLTVNGGSGDGDYLPGTRITIIADAASAGQVFDKWTGQTAQVADIHQSETTLLMPFSAANVTATYRPQGETSYTLTVNNGTGDGTYLPGTVVNIAADVAPAGQVFDKWVGQTNHVANINLPNTTIIMPFSATTVVATYKTQDDTYKLTVYSGTGGGTYTEGTVVSISADTSEAGIVFDKWTGDSIYIANINLPNTTFVMPSYAAAVTATYIKVTQMFSLTVNDGAGSADYLPGTVVDIAANKPPTGKVFDRWIGNTANIENINLPNTTIVMPFSYIEIMATYREQGSTEYMLTVTDGAGGGSYPPGTIVTISANIPGTTKVFDKWVGDTANIANIFLSNTAISTPFYAATVVAT